MRHKVSFASSAAAAVVLVILYFVRREASPAAEAPPPAIPSPTPSEFPLCREIDAFGANMHERLRCTTDDSQFRKAVCEQAFTVKQACQSSLRAAWDCMRKEPETSWRCDNKGKLAIRDGICTNDINALSTCLQD
jgi:hypothetical protein